MRDGTFGSVQEAAAISSDRAGAKRRREKPLIAIVDDDLLVCRTLKRLLATHGIRAETFNSSSIFVEVVRSLLSFEPECVVLDMHMPGLSGLDVHKLLTPIRPGIRVVYLTSTHDSASYKRALALGAVAFFKKPFPDDLDEFVRTVCAIVGIAGPR